MTISSTQEKSCSELLQARNNGVPDKTSSGCQHFPEGGLVRKCFDCKLLYSPKIRVEVCASLSEISAFLGEGWGRLRRDHTNISRGNG